MLLEVLQCRKHRAPASADRLLPYQYCITNLFMVSKSLNFKIVVIKNESYRSENVIGGSAPQVCRVVAAIEWTNSLGSLVTASHSISTSCRIRIHIKKLFYGES